MKVISPTTSTLCFLVILLFGIVPFARIPIAHAASTNLAMPNVSVCQRAGTTITASLTANLLASVASWQVNVTFSNLAVVTQSLGTTWTGPSHFATNKTNSGSTLFGYAILNGGSFSSTKIVTLLTITFRILLQRQSSSIFHIVLSSEGNFATELLRPDLTSQTFTTTDGAFSNCNKGQAPIGTSAQQLALAIQRSPSNALGSTLPVSPQSVGPESSSLAQNAQPADPGSSAANAVSSGATLSMNGPSVVTSPVSYAGLDESASGFYAPPDTQIAVGSNYVIEMTNLATRVFSRADNSVKTTYSLYSSTIYNVPATDFLTDPKVLYDSATQRFFATLSDLTTGNILLAVTSDPSAGWTAYKTLMNVGANCPDQPILGISDSVVVVSANVFSASCKLPYLGSEYWVINKSDLVNGVSNPSVAPAFGPDLSISSAHPVQSLTTSSVAYIVGNPADLSKITLVTVTGTPPAKVSASSVSISIQPISLTNGIVPDAPQPRTALPIQLPDYRVLSATSFGSKIWLAFDEACMPTGDSTTRTCFRLIQIDTSTSNAAQDFTVGAKGQYYFYPSLGIDSQGDVAVVFSYSSSSTATGGSDIYPSVGITGQGALDPLGSLAPAVTIVSGTNSDTESFACNPDSYRGGIVDCRFGDYSGAASDPTDTCQVWVAGEYYPSSVWSTYIAAVRSSSCLTFNYSPSLPYAGVSETFSPTWPGGTQPVAFAWNFGDGGIGYSDQLPGDINREGVVNILDLVTVGGAYGSTAGTPAWNPSADLNHDGRIDILDLVIVAKYFGSTCCYPATVGHAYVIQELHTVALTAVDAKGQVATTYRTINVAGPACFAQSATIIPIGGSISLDGSCSSSNGAGTLYEWDFGDGSSAAGLSYSTTSHTYPNSGQYVITLTVVPFNSPPGSTSAVVKVDPPPTAVIVAPSTAPHGTKVIFDGSKSTDQYGTITFYSWDFGDGNAVGGPTPMSSRTYANPGSYTVNLYITDNFGLHGTTNVTILIT